MKSSNEFRVQLVDMQIEIARYYSELIKIKNPIVIFDGDLDSEIPDDHLTVNGSITGIAYDVYPLKATDDGIEVCEVDNTKNRYKIYLGNIFSVENRLYLIELMEQNIGNIKDLGNLKEVGGTFNPNEI